MEVPNWLTVVAWISLIIGFVCAFVVAADIIGGRRQKMGVMNFVWPLNPLYMGVFGLWAYFSFGRAKKTDNSHNSENGDNRDMDGMKGDKKQNKEKPPEHPKWKTVFKGDTHCGAGCTLGDITGDWIAFLLGLTIAGIAFWAKLIAEFSCAFLIGVAFQYFAIAPMRNLGVKDGILAALKADTLSITSFEVGMLAWMAFTRFGIFHRDIPPTQPAYWFLMQIAMLIGFATNYPMNYWLIKKGWKEAM